MKAKIKNYQIILLEVLLFISTYIIINTTIFSKLTECYIYKKTHILCPGCGGTRCVKSLLKGDIVSAFNYHPIFTITAIYLIICNIIYLINRKKQGNKILTWIYPKAYYTIILAIILIIYTILRNI